MPADPGDVTPQSLTGGLAEPACFVPPVAARSSRRFGLVWLLTALALAALWPFLTLGWINRYDDGEVAFVAGVYARKSVAASRSAGRADTQHKPRVVILGGSGALFGVDAELIERKLGVPCVNLAVHAGLGTRYLLIRARRDLRPGDVVVLTPEYQLWDEPPDPLTDLAWGYASTYDKSFFIDDVPWRDALRMMYSVPVGDYWAAQRGWRKRLRGEHHHTRPGYDCGTIDECGDLRGAPPRRPFEVPAYYPFPDVRAARSVPLFREFAAWAAANHVRVFFSWPGMCRPVASHPDAPPPEMTALLKELDFVTLDTPADNAYPAEWFTDTPYHPDPACRWLRTDSLVRHLRPHLGLPPAPERPTGILVIGPGAGRPSALNTFTDDPGVQPRYLSAAPVEHPAAVGPAELNEALARGLAVYCGEDLDGLDGLTAAGWHAKEVAAETATLAEWVTRYDRHLFLLTGYGLAPQPPPVPPEFTSGRCVVFGTGPWAGTRRVEYEIPTTDLRSLVRAPVPQLQVALTAPTGPPGTIVVNRRQRAAGGPGVAVVVLDVEMGTLVDTATFAPGTSGTATRRLLRLTRD